MILLIRGKKKSRSKSEAINDWARSMNIPKLEWNNSSDSRNLLLKFRVRDELSVISEYFIVLVSIFISACLFLLFGLATYDWCTFVNIALNADFSRFSNTIINPIFSFPPKLYFNMEYTLSKMNNKIIS